jgi:hypothetical protein
MSLPDDGRTTVSAEVPPDLSHDGRLGPYRLIREIGHGGMGTVFLGVRDDDVSSLSPQLSKQPGTSQAPLALDGSRRAIHDVSGFLH